LDKKSLIYRDFDPVHQQQSRTTKAESSHLESDLIGRSAHKFTMASNSLKEMQEAIVSA